MELFTYFFRKERKYFKTGYQNLVCCCHVKTHLNKDVDFLLSSFTQLYCCLMLLQKPILTTNQMRVFYLLIVSDFAFAYTRWQPAGCNFWDTKLFLCPTGNVAINTDQQFVFFKKHIFKVTVQFETEGNRQNEIGGHMDRSEGKL